MPPLSCTHFFWLLISPYLAPPAPSRCRSRREDPILRIARQTQASVRVIIHGINKTHHTHIKEGNRHVIIYAQPRTRLRSYCHIVTCIQQEQNTRHAKNDGDNSPSSIKIRTRKREPVSIVLPPPTNTQRNKRKMFSFILD